jgi:hypothetical protein
MDHKHLELCSQKCLPLASDADNHMVLFIFDNSLDNCIGDINDSDVSILECIDYACEHYCFSQNYGRADILFSDVVSLLVSTNHLPGLDL